MIIDIDNRQNELDINDDLKDIIVQSIETALSVEGIDEPKEVSVSLVTSEEIKTLNKEYRNIDRITDVLSFPSQDEFFPNILGDIVICTSRAMEQAKEYQHSFSREISFLTVHSVFHLLGYDHLNEDEKRAWTEYDLADRLRYYGWQLPAYPLPKNLENVTIMRVVVRADQVHVSHLENFMSLFVELYIALMI